jgi:CO/xanthine dehydrogenase Mo-binding subunit
VADHKLVGQNYTTPDIVAKVTGKAKYAEDFRADGMLFAKLLLSPLPHARVKSIDASAALAMPGVKAILTVDDLPPETQEYMEDYIPKYIPRHRVVYHWFDVYDLEEERI